MQKPPRFYDMSQALVMKDPEQCHMVKGHA